MLHQCSIYECDPILTKLQTEFPKELRSKELYYTGSLPVRDRFHLGIIGSRRPSPETWTILERLLSPLSELPLRIISGGALGVDAQAHATALKYKIPTYSWVVGDPCAATPHTNRLLFNKISHAPASAIITPTCLYRHRNIGLHSSFWLERNAWIAANSDLLVVIQAKEQSGTWSTVKVCQDLGISVYAITGSPLDPCYSGNNLMISMSYAHPLPQIPEFVAELKEYLKKTEKNEGMGIAYSHP